MSFALNLASDGRILSATYGKYAAPGAVMADALPEGDISDHRYVNGAFVYDPLPAPEPPETGAADTNIPAGTYFMVGGALYRSTSSIASGEAIAPGANCAAVDLAAVLNELNS